MRFTSLFTLGVRLSFATAVIAQSTSVDSYISTESPIAKAGLLANIGPSGAKSNGAKVNTRFTAPQRVTDLLGVCF